MTHLSMENMNGVSRLMLRRISPGRTRLSLSDIVPSEQTPTSDDDLGLDPKGLSPNVAPWWKQPPIQSDEITTQRGTPPPGRLRIARSADRAAQPMTPNNDARDLTNSFTGRRLEQYRRQDYPGSFPHTWKPYEEIRPAVGPEMGPTPPGWEPMPTESQLKRGALDSGGNVPWSSEDNMAHDISGFSSLHQINGMGQLALIIGRRVRQRVQSLINTQFPRTFMGAIPGMVVSLDDPTVAAATNAVTQQATTAAANGASDKTVEQIIQLGAQITVAGLQAAGKLPATTGPVKPAASSVLPSFLTSGNNTPLYVAGGLTLAAAIALAVAAGRKKGRR